MQEEQQLKDVGLKITLPRLKVLQVLKQYRDHHLNAEKVYKVLLDMGEDIGLATVYRVLTQFEAAGIVIRHHFASNHSVFELRQTTHHDHLVCTQCGKVEEFLDDIIEQRQQIVAQQAQFHMTDHSLNIYGICSICQNA